MFKDVEILYTLLQVNFAVSSSRPTSFKKVWTYLCRCMLVVQITNVYILYS